MLNLWNTWIDATSLALDAQRVIGLRLMRIAAGGPQATAEAQRMVREKFETFAAAQMAAGIALAQGSSFAVASERAAAPVRRRVRANRRRLSRAQG